MDTGDIEIIRNYNTDELMVYVNELINNSGQVASIIACGGETIEDFSLSEGKNIIPLKSFLYKNYSIRITSKNNVVHYAL